VPEGDTVHQARLRLLPVLQDSTVERLWVRRIRGHRPRSGQRIETVRAQGKHLLIDFDRALTLQVHLGLGGWWQVQAGVGEEEEAFARYRRNPRLRLYLATDNGIATCYSAPTIQTFLRPAVTAAAATTPTITPLSNLGPDLTVGKQDREATVVRAVQRLRVRSAPTELIADALLDQQVAAGTGNVYKSEILFINGVWPFTPVGDLSDDQLHELFDSASHLLWINSQRPDTRRTTTPFSGSLADLHGGVFVYRRHRAPCRRCAAPIERSYDGRLGRSTYWCPRCQPAPPAGRRPAAG